MNKKKINTDEWTDEDYDNFLDYLEDLDDLNDNLECEEDDEKEITNYINEEVIEDFDNQVINLKPKKISDNLKNITFGINDENGSSFTFGLNGINLKLNSKTIKDTFKSIQYNNLKRKYNKLKKKK